MSQPTPKPLTAEEEAAFRKICEKWPGSMAIERALLATIDSLRAAVAEAEKQRDEARRDLGERITHVGPFHDDESGFGIDWVKDGLAYSLSIESDGADYTVFEGHRVVDAKEWKNPAFVRLAAELTEARKVVEAATKGIDVIYRVGLQNGLTDRAYRRETEPRLMNLRTSLLLAARDSASKEPTNDAE